MPDGIPKPEKGALVLQAETKLDQVYDVGKTPYRSKTSPCRSGRQGIRRQDRARCCPAASISS